MVATTMANPIVVTGTRVVAVMTTAIPSVVINLPGCDHSENCDRSF